MGMAADLPWTPRAHPWLHEPLAVLDLVWAVPNLVRIRPRPQHERATVVVLPGLYTSDRSTAVLRAGLARAGHMVHPWGLGSNHGRLDRLVPAVAARLERVGRAVLVGWSFGGVIAREVARRHPDRVVAVVTLGTPVVGGATYTVFAASYRRRGVDLGVLERRAAAREREPIPMSVTAIYTRGDGVVAAAASVDPYNSHVDHVEVGGSHIGLVLRPEALERVEAAVAAATRGDGGRDPASG
ncbi:MAG: pimeloyl-ACP methyl ester carboxylesterase [Myxococcota bacterium]|jgi:pimeloyl-ACP methyl ester carboxylesterase